jgi:hypothetical protein
VAQDAFSFSPQRQCRQNASNQMMTSAAVTTAPCRNIQPRQIEVANAPRADS